MRQTWFWIKLSVFLPSLEKTARKLLEWPFEKRYEKVRELAKWILTKVPVEVRTQGTNNIPLKDGNLFVGNHQGSLDAFVILSSCPVSLTAVSKKEGEKIPVLGSFYKTLEVIFFDRDNMRDAVRMVSEVAGQLKNGRNVLIFPEGTRSKSQKLGEFKPGAFKAAVRAKAPIVPVVQINSYIPLDSKEKIKPIQVVYLQPLVYEEYAEMSTSEIAEEIRFRIQETIDQYAE